MVDACSRSVATAVLTAKAPAIIKDISKHSAQLRQGLVIQYGYIAYLASWLAKHKPIPLLGATLLLSAVAIGGDSLQIDSQLPAASVNVLMALLLLGVFGWGQFKKPTNS